MATPVALIVDDEPDILELIGITLNKMSIDTAKAASLNEAKLILSRKAINLCLTDMRLTDGTGLELVEHIQSEHPNIPVAVITAHGNVSSAVNALKAGAFDYVAKPVDISVLRGLVSSALKLTLETPAQPSTQLLGESEGIQQLQKTISKLSRSQAPVCIIGPSGSGKELVARLIHEQGPRNGKPFIAVNCGAIPHELIESECFGHVKGSFTGANQDKTGLFAAANEGTLFLDEIADLPLSMQVKLLRAIQEKSIRPVGGLKEIPVDIRFISATHNDLQQCVTDGQFREDLFYRINVITVPIPGLNERKSDIPLLVQHFLYKLNEQEQRQVELSAEALAALNEYAFPGNVRELENILQRAFALCEDERISAEDLQLPACKQPEHASQTAGNLDPLLNDVERNAISDALEKTKWNKTKAAELLGITLRTLRYRMKKLDLE